MKYFITNLFLFCFGILFSQSSNEVSKYLIDNPNIIHRCYAQEHHDHRYETDHEYQHWYNQEKIIVDQIIANSAFQSRLDCSNPLLIPIAVHYEGVTNESLACLTDLALSQIEVLNEDYSATNSDIVNYCNDVDNSSLDPNALAFNGTCLQFCLATQNHPAGFGLNNGDYAITTNQGYHDGTFGGAFTENAWSGYLNLIVNTIDGGGILGYSPTPGSGNGDAVVIGKCFFGKQGSGCGSFGPDGCNTQTYNQGRTGTHEVGHYFSLQHIWGGGDCGADDGFADTPTSGNEYYGCPNPGTNTCGSDDMYMNFMDYVDDACMYMFSEQQANAMYTRANMINWGSNKCSGMTYPAPILPAGCNPAALDAGIQNHITPTNGSINCTANATITPIVVLQNFGSTTLTNVTINYQINGGTPVSFNWTGSLAQGATTNVTLPSYTEPAGNYTFTSSTDNPNGSTDENTSNDGITTNHQTASSNALPYFEDFEDGSFNPTNSGLSVINPDGDIFEWVQANTSGNGAGSFSASFDNLNGDVSNNPQGTRDHLRTPVFDFSNVIGATLSFDVAYAPYDNSFFDALEVNVSTNCGTSYTDVIFNEGGTVLATAPATIGQFIPSAGQWKNVSLDLSAYDGQPTVSFSFDNLSGWGNFLYLDNINVTTSTPTTCSVALNTMDETCFSDCDGSITATGSGGTPPYSYVWNNTQTSSTISNLCPGTYTVTLSDGNGCTSSASTTINGNSQILVNVTETATSCLGNDGVVSVNVTGGTGSYTYIWNNNNTTNTINSLTPGTYIVTVTDGNNCTTVADAFVQDGCNCNINVFIDPLDEQCAGDCSGIITLIPSGGTPPYDYIWSDNQTSDVADNLCPGTYTATVTDATGCSTTASISIGTTSDLTLATSSTDESCQGNDGTATVQATSGIGTYTYLWNNNGTDNNISNLTSGNYTVTVTDGLNCTSTAVVLVGNDCGCNMAANNLILAEESCPGVCNGSAQAITTGGTPPYSYFWPDNQTTEIGINLCNGTYDVTIIDAVGCAATTTVIIGVGQGLAINGTATPESCTGNDGAATVSVTGGDGNYNYLWNNNGTDNVISNLPSGNYTVTVTDGSGCSATQIVLVPDGCNCNLIINMDGQNENCQGACDGNGFANVTGGTPPYTFLWSDNQTSSTADNLCSGAYSVTASDAAGCTVVGDIFISPGSPFSAIATSSPVSCQENDGSATVTNIGGDGPFTYLWNNNATDATISNLTEGTYIVTITDALGCTASVSTIVGVDCSAFISIVITQTDISCTGTCDGTATANVSGGTPPYSYQWTGGQVTQTAVSLCPDIYNVTVTDIAGLTEEAQVIINEPNPLEVSISGGNANCGTPSGFAIATAIGGTLPYSYTWDDGTMSNALNNLNGGTYVVYVTDIAGCEATATITIEETPALAFTGITTDASCFGENDGNIDVIITEGTPPFMFNWSNGEVTEDINNLSAGTYDLIVTDAGNCSGGTTFFVGEPIEIVIDMQVTNATTGDDNGSIIASTSGGSAPYTWQWSNGNTGVFNGNLAPGVYSVVVTDANGCLITAEAVVEETTNIVELDVVESWMIYPNPNSGSFNVDLKLHETKDIEIRVFNIFGQSIYYRNHKSNELNTVMDLRHVSPGTYFIQIVVDNSRIVEKLTIID